MREKTKLFYELSGLSPEEACDFLNYKIKEMYPDLNDESTITAKDFEFAMNLAAEAKIWKLRKINKVDKNE
jgi:hypothetical protein